MKMLNSIVPILAADEKGYPRGVGTGFLLTFADHCLCVTAAHVADEVALGPLYLPSKDGCIVELPKDFVGTVAPQGKREKDKIDLGFWKLDPDQAKEIEHERMFLPSLFIQTNAPTTPKFQYTFVGYPHKATKVVQGTNRVKIDAESFTGHCVSLKTLESIGGKSQTHFGIEFDSKKAVLNQRIVTPRDRRGMSGGPVFAMTDGLGFDRMPKIRVVGVAIEHHKDKKAVLCVRIEMLLQIVSKHFKIQKFLVSDANISHLLPSMLPAHKA